MTAMIFLSYFNTSQLSLFISAYAIGVLSMFLFMKERHRMSILLLFGAALLLRLVMAGIDPFFHYWDEQVHALVAKNILLHPLKPTLFENPVLPFDPNNWLQCHVWVHKQPLYLWQIALSLKIFGFTEFAVRFPSALMSSLLVLLLYRIGSITVSKKVGWCAAFVFCFSIMQNEFVSGAYPTDHNDIAFMFYITCSVWALLEYSRTAAFKWVILIGLFAGLAVLTKWVVGLIVFPCWGLLVLSVSERRKSFKSYKHIAISVITAVIVFAPWQLFILNAYPDVSRFEYNDASSHLLHVQPGHQGDNWFYYDWFSMVYGRMSLLFVLPGLIFLYKRCNYESRVILFSLLVAIYLFFTIAATKMFLFVYPAAAVIFLGFGALVQEAVEFVSQQVRKMYLRGTIIIAGLVLLGALDHNIEKLELGHTRRSQEFYYNLFIKNTIINKRYRDYGWDNNTVVLNCGGLNCIQFMFYNNCTAYGNYPGVEDIKLLKQKKCKVFAFIDKNAPDYILNDKYIQKLTGGPEMPQ